MASIIGMMEEAEMAEFAIHYMPGQKPYTPDELTELNSLVEMAALAVEYMDPEELDEFERSQTRKVRSNGRKTCERKSHS